MDAPERNPRLLIVGLAADEGEAVARRLARVGFLVDVIADAEAAVARIEVEQPALCVVQLDAAGEGWLERILALHPRPRVLALVQRPEYESVCHWVRQGVLGFQGFPCPDHQLLAACERALEPDEPRPVDERRAHPRRRLTVEVEVATPQYQRVALGELVDLSARGAQIELASSLEPGTAVRVGLGIDGTRLPLELDGLVLWRRAGRRQLCHGVAFLDLTPQTHRQLDILLGADA